MTIIKTIMRVDLLFIPKVLGWQSDAMLCSLGYVTRKTNVAIMTLAHAFH